MATWLKRTGNSRNNITWESEYSVNYNTILHRYDNTRNGIQWKDWNSNFEGRILERRSNTVLNNITWTSENFSILRSFINDCIIFKDSGMSKNDIGIFYDNDRRKMVSNNDLNFLSSRVRLSLNGYTQSTPSDILSSTSNGLLLYTDKDCTKSIDEICSPLLSKYQGKTLFTKLEIGDGGKYGSFSGNFQYTGYIRSSNSRIAMLKLNTSQFICSSFSGYATDVNFYY